MENEIKTPAERPSDDGDSNRSFDLDADGDNSPHGSMSGIDATGATISQDWGSTLSGTDEDIEPDSLPPKPDAPSILLPNQSDYVSHIALDLGGSLIKLVYFTMDTQHHPSPGGKLHFVKFETSKLDECIDFIEAKGLHRFNGNAETPMRVKATGGGAYKYAERFKERLGLILEKEDEMGCMVDGCNFLLKAVRHEAFTYQNSHMAFQDINTPDLYPFLLVNIGSGVSMVKVDGEGDFQRVSGTNIGGGTFWGLCRLLTGLTSFDDILQLSSEGDNSSVDMLVGDIYGGRDYTSIGLSANTIASSFGKAMYSDMELSDYNPADIAMSLCRMISYNIGQLAYLNAMRYNLKRIFFGGFFIRGHPYTMETISFAINFWSKGDMAAMFLRHEGFLGSVGAFMRVQDIAPLKSASSHRDSGKAKARFVERFSMGAPVVGGLVQGPIIHSMRDKINWVEKFIAAGRPVTEAAKTEHELAIKEQQQGQMRRTGDGSEMNTPRIDFHVGVLHFTPSSEPFPLLADVVHYNPNTIDINVDHDELGYWAGILQDQIPTSVEKAAASEGSTEEASRRAAAFGRALDLHLTKLKTEPGSYGCLGLADLFELREECLREFGFADVFSKDKARENDAALEALKDLLGELDESHPGERLLFLLQGVLAANIFDWGAKACVEMYQSATILEMYREARTNLSCRPWRVDDFDAFADSWFSKSDLDEEGKGRMRSRYRRVIMFVDNAGADVVLGMLPFARELLRMGAEVVLVANTLPAINDITAAELKSVVARAAELCPIIQAARNAAVAAEAANQGRVPPLPGLSARIASTDKLSSLVNGAGSSTGGLDLAKRLQLTPTTPSKKGMFGESYPSRWNEPRLYIIASGHGSPCLDLRRVNSDVADATVGADLVVIEGMGRAIHTNYNTKFKCDSLKLAMIKNQHLAQKLFNGNVYDCVCRFDEGN